MDIKSDTKTGCWEDTDGKTPYIKSLTIKITKNLETNQSTQNLKDLNYFCPVLLNKCFMS